MASIKDELMREFDVEINKRPNGQRDYTFKRKAEYNPENENTEVPETSPSTSSDPISEFQLKYGPCSDIEELAAAKSEEEIEKE